MFVCKTVNRSASAPQIPLHPSRHQRVVCVVGPASSRASCALRLDITLSSHAALADVALVRWLVILPGELTTSVVWA